MKTKPETKIDYTDNSLVARLSRMDAKHRYIYKNVINEIHHDIITRQTN